MARRSCTRISEANPTIRSLCLFPRHVVSCFLPLRLDDLPGRIERNLVFVGEFFLLRGHTEERGGSSAMRMTHLLRVACAFLLTTLWFVGVASAQTETATVSGLITDETGAVVPGAEVKLQSVDRGTTTTTTTNDAGIYVFASVHPGQYQVTVHRPGFKQVDLLGMIVNVQDHIEQNFRLQIGSVAESVTVNANDLHLNTTDGSVSTVVDQTYVKNMPLNGRSFQDLILLTPGIVTNSPQSGSTLGATGEFSVNGQRTES